MSSKRYWLPHDDLAWTPADLIKNDGSYCKWTLHNGQCMTTQNNVIDPATLATTNKDSTCVSGNIDNLECLDEVCDASVLHSLRQRYERDQIYTSIGPILVSVNPYKLLPIYGARSIAKYPPASTARLSQIEPHVFTIAAAAYHQLINNRVDQAIIISGESGAGKTEATKTVLSYLSEVTAAPTHDTSSSTLSSNSLSTPTQILLSNPILESFGNAKTLRNNNSSRFGKYMQVHISLKSRSIIAAKISHYLLEKSRVTRVTPNERNYHVFYQMLNGLSDTEKCKYKLKNVQDYAYLNQSSCLSIDGVNEGQDWAKTMDAMQRLEFSATEIDSIISALASILQIGNLGFTEERVHNMDSTRIDNKNGELEAAATNLHVSVDALSQAIRHRTVTVRGELSIIPLNLNESIDSRDALCRALYDKLFTFIVARLNCTLMKEQNFMPTVDLSHARSIGILDIFGFEIFEKNLFEQFCINLANEKLQQHFNNHIFKREREVYAKENIQAEDIEFVDNLACLNMMEGKQGIIAMMNEEIVLPQGSDKSLVEKMHKRFALDKVTRSNYYEHIKKSPNLFVVRHYAGDVAYDSDGLIAKNKNKLHDVLEELIKLSKLELWRSVERVEHLRQMELAALQAEGEGHNGQRPFPTRTLTSATMGSTKKLKSLGMQFSQQLTALMEVLNTCEPHFIRCIKPNYVKKSDRFDAQLVLAQLSYAGLFEALKVRRSGYSYRKEFQPFLKEYRILFSATQLKTMSTLNEGEQCNTILKLLSVHLEPSQWQIGLTKVFMRNTQRVILAQLKDEAMTIKAVILQAGFRACVAKRRAKALKMVYTECIKVLSGDVRSKREMLSEVAGRLHNEAATLFVAKNLKAIHLYLVEEDRLESLASNALHSAPSLSSLQDALEGITRLQKKTPTTISPPLSTRLSAHLESIHLEIVRLKTIDAEKQKLRNFVLLESENDIRQSLKQLIEMSAKEDEEMRRAKLLLQQLESENGKWTSLEVALVAQDADAIQASLNEVRVLKSRDAGKSQLIQNARQTLVLLYTQQLEDIMENEDEIQLNTSTLPKLEQLQFVDLVKRAQAWLDDMEARRLATLQQGRMEDEERLKAMEDSRRHGEQSVKRIEKMERIEKRREESERLEQLREAAPLTSISLGALLDLGGPSSSLADDDADLFFPPPPSSSCGEQRDARLQTALNNSDFVALAVLVSSAQAAGHSSHVLRTSEALLAQQTALETVNCSIRRIQENGYEDDQAIDDVLSKAQQANLDQEHLVKELRLFAYSMSPTERMEVKLQHARQVNNLPKLMYLLNQAKEQNLSSSSIEDALQACKQPEFMQSMQLHHQLPSVVDKERSYVGAITDQPSNADNHTLLRTKYQMFLDAYRDRAEAGMFLTLQAYPFLRPASNFSKHSLFNKAKVERLMLKHQKEDLASSLLHLSSSVCGSKKESLRLKTVARQLFKNIRGYCGDSYHPYPCSLAYEVVLTGVNELPLRDEIYAQLLKQTAENPSSSSTILAYKMLYLCLSTFAPSRTMVPFVFSLIAAQCLSELPEGTPQWRSISEISSRAWIVWHQKETERQMFEEDLAKRTERGDQFNTGKVRDFEKMFIKMPSMNDIELLTCGLSLNEQPATDYCPQFGGSALNMRKRGSRLAIEGGRTPLSPLSPHTIKEVNNSSRVCVTYDYSSTPSSVPVSPSIPIAPDLLASNDEYIGDPSARLTRNAPVSSISAPNTPNLKPVYIQYSNSKQVDDLPIHPSPFPPRISAKSACLLKQIGNGSMCQKDIPPPPVLALHSSEIKTVYDVPPPPPLPHFDGIITSISFKK